MTTTADVYFVDGDSRGRSELIGALQRARVQTRSYTSAEQFLGDYDACWSGCVLVDVDLPGMSGLELQQRLLHDEASLGIIFVSGNPRVQDSVAAMRAGAVDFFVKPCDTDALVARVKETLAQVASQRATKREHKRTMESYRRLRPREREVLHLLLDSSGAMSSKSIASSLGISPRTVEHYRAALMTKMEAESLTELLLRISKAFAARQ